MDGWANGCSLYLIKFRVLKYSGLELNLVEKN